MSINLIPIPIEMFLVLKAGVTKLSPLAILYSFQPDGTVQDLHWVVLLDGHVCIFRCIKVNASITGRLSHIVEASDDLIRSQVELPELVENVVNRCPIAQVWHHQNTAWITEVTWWCPVWSNRTILSIWTVVLWLRSRLFVTAEGTQNSFDLFTRDQHDLNSVLLQELVGFRNRSLRVVRILELHEAVTARLT